MDRTSIDWRLYGILDEGFVRGRNPVRLAEEAIEGGVTILQYRNKTDPTRSFYEKALLLLSVTRRFGIPLIINDRCDIVLAVGAEGIHVGEADLPVTVLRSLLGDQRLIGVSIRSPEDLSTVHKADYLGVGALFQTQSKKDTQVIGLAPLRKIRRKTALPLVGIGGLDAETAELAIEAGCDGVAVISALFASEDVLNAARRLREAVDRALRRRKIRQGGA